METSEGQELCFPHLFNASCKKIPRSYATTMLIYTVLYLMSAVTSTLNLLVIISISHYKQLHTPTNLLLLSLGVSDFSVGLLMFVQTLFVDGCWLFSDDACVVYQYLSFFVPCSSVATVVLISVDRYIAICQPLHYHTKVTKVRVRFSICLSWLWPAVYSALLLSISALVDSNKKNTGSFGTCSGECVLIVHFYLGVVDLLLSFIFPVGAIAVLYMRVFVAILTQIRAMRSQIRAATSQRAVYVNESELKAARTLGVVIVLFVVCLCPFYFVTLLDQKVAANGSNAAIVLYLFYFNSCLNPIIYSFFYSWFRKCIKSIVTLDILRPGSSKANIMFTDK